MREGGKKLLGDKRSNPTARFVRRWEEHWKGMFVPSTLFEEMGFHYTGPIDGHDLPALARSALKTLKGLKGPQLLHVITTKGKGYELAEGDQIDYHAVVAVRSRRRAWSSKAGAKKPTYTDVFGDWLCDMAAADDALLGITPAMREGSGLVRFSQGISRSAISTSRSPSSTRSRSPRAWPAKAPSRWSRSTPPSCSAPTTS